MNIINEILRINNLELEKGLTYTSGSWHSQYRNSSWVYAGNLPLNLTEGDVICILSQYGEIDDIHLVRDGDTGKSKGFAFVKYTDARSAVLSVDNFTGSMVLGRTLRVDHVENYRLPKHVREKEEKEREEMKLKGDKCGDDSSNNSDDDAKDAGGGLAGVAESGYAYKGQELASSYDIHSGQDLFARLPQILQMTEREEKHHDAGTSVQHGGGESEKEERRRRKEERARKRKEKEKHRQLKEERKRRKKKH